MLAKYINRLTLALCTTGNRYYHVYVKNPPF